MHLKASDIQRIITNKQIQKLKQQTKMKSIISTLALVGLSQAAHDQTGRSTAGKTQNHVMTHFTGVDLEYCPMKTNDVECHDQSAKLYLAQGCMGNLYHELTDQYHAYGSGLMFGGQFSSLQLPAYSTAVLYDSMNYEG